MSDSFKDIISKIGIAEGIPFNSLKGGSYILNSHGSLGGDSTVISIKRSDRDDFKYGCEFAVIKNANEMMVLLKVLLIVTEQMYINNNESLINL